MEMSSKRTWDWTVAGLFVTVILTAAVRLVATEWTTHLYFAETMGLLGACVGLALGTSRFRAALVRWLGLGYTLTILAFQMAVLSEMDITFGERLVEIGSRIGLAIQIVARGQELGDPILFISFIILTFWLVGIIGGYRLAHHRDLLTAILPSGLIILVIHIYDSTNPSRIWLLAFYLFLVILVMGRVHYLEDSRGWRQQRVLQKPETERDISSGLMLTAALVVLVTWALPLSLSNLRAATDFWQEFTRPLRPIRDDISRALDPLDSPYGGRGGKADFYAETLALGRGLPLSGDIILRVQAPDDLVNPPPRYYWRGRVFSTYNGTDWVNVNSQREVYDSLAADISIPDMTNREVGTFVIRNAVEQSLIYAPGQPIWNNLSGEMLFNPIADNERDLFSFQATPPMKPRESYEVHGALINPTIEDMQNAGTEYPAWVTSTYLQLPENFSPRIRDLAAQIAVGTVTPYDKAQAVTVWLRKEIKYEAVIPAPPVNTDPLEWVLFDYKQSFCVYYATSETLMLRSLGVPVRMAVGFAQGELDEETNSYTVRRKDFHAWPEVYFPGIGWVEFEPTASQDELQRPINNEVVIPAGPTLPLPVRPDTGEPVTPQTTPTKPAIPWTVTYRLPIVWVSWIALLLALWGLNRQTGWVGRIPVYLETRALRAGNEPPRWIRLWAGWTRLAPVARAYESINLSLRVMGESQPAHVTPAERAKRLTSLVPAAQAWVKELIEEHERVLYAGGESRVSVARKSALFILLTTIWARLIQLGASFEERFSRPNSFR